MKRRPFKLFQSVYFRIPLIFIFILLIAFQFFGVYFVEQIEEQSVSNFKSQINTQADFLVSNVSPILEDQEKTTEELNGQITQTLDTFRSNVRSEIIIVDSENTVVGTSQTIQQPFIGRKNTDQSIKNVAINKQTYSTEISIGKDSTPYYLVIKPVFEPEGSRFVGVVAIRSDMSGVYTDIGRTTNVFLKAIALAVLVALALAIVVSQGITRPIEEMRQQANRISEGIYNYPAMVYGEDELGELTMSINELADRVRESRESTESERQRLAGVLRHMTDGVIGTNQRGLILFINEKASELLDIKEEQAIGRSVISLLGISDQFTVKELMSKEAEITLTRPGEYYDTVIKGEFSLIRRGTGFVTGLVCVLTDITEQERTEQERRDFVSNVSHELRTPLTSIKSYSEALVDGAWQDPEITQQFSSVILSESDRMIRMISNLLDLSKMDGGNVVLRKEYVNLKSFMNYILDRFEFTLESAQADKNYKIIRQFTPRDLYVDIDQDRMTQVFDNLLNNAAKYSPDGGTIKITIAEEHEKVVVAVSDEGLGIAPKDITHLFERFYRVDKARSREQGGSGLGLAISKEVVELHNGQIWADSVEGEGSTFYVELPFIDSVDIYGDDSWDDYGDPEYTEEGSVKANGIETKLDISPRTLADKKVKKAMNNRRISLKRNIRQKTEGGD